MSRLTFSSPELPPGAELDSATGVLNWIPTEAQLDAFLVPVHVEDDGMPPLSDDDMLAIRVQPLDACVVPACNPATGCAYSLPPLTQACCTAGPPAVRVPEPEAECPGARVVHVGRNLESGFGRLHNCDRLRAFNSGQIGVTILFHIETRCFRVPAPLQVDVRMATANRLFFSRSQRVNFMDRGDGYGEKLRLALPVGGPSPFFDLDQAEADLEVTVYDDDGSSATERVRLVLQFDSLGDLPETR